MLLEGRVQRSDVNMTADGVITTPRFGAQQEMFVADAHARYYDAVRRGNVFVASNTAAVATNVVATSMTAGLCLWNPPNSGKNAVLLRLNVALQSLPAGAAGLVLAGGSQPLIPASAFTVLTGTGAYNGTFNAMMSTVGASGNRSVCQAASVANAIGTIIFRWIGGGPAATVSGSTAFPPFICDEIAGDLIIPPGNLVALETVTTVMSTGSTLIWEEVPV